MDNEHKFKIGDTIETKEQGRGFEKATILGSFKETKGRFKGQEMYLLKIMNGTATMPITTEVNYQLKKK